MSATLFGRTNREYPPVWLRLVPPVQSSDPLEEGRLLADAALATGAPLDISAGPALWGAVLGKRADAVLMQVSSTHHERATEAAHAADLIQAHLIETLSSLGRPHIDFYFLRSRTVLEEMQITGVLEALESARQEGHISFFGLHAEGPEHATLGNWRLHDAFEVVSVEPGSKELSRVAKERRVGIVTRGSSPLPSLITVRTVQEVERAVGTAVGGGV